MAGQGSLKLSDDAFWTTQLDLEPYLGPLMKVGEEVLLLDGPRAVDVRARTTLPVVALSVVKNETAIDWTFRDNALVVASQFDRFQSLAAQALPLERPLVRGPKPVLTREMRGGISGDDVVFDVRRRLQLPWEPGVWQLLLITRDRRSEPARVVLHSGGALPPAPAPLPGAQLKLSASGKGLDTSLDLKLKARASRAVLEHSQDGNDVAVPVTFVVTGHAQPIPYVVRRAVPGHWGPPGEAEHVVASARIAVKELVPEGVEDTALYVWAFAGDQVSTPLRVALP